MGSGTMSNHRNPESTWASVPRMFKKNREVWEHSIMCTGISLICCPLCESFDPTGTHVREVFKLCMK